MTVASFASVAVIYVLLKFPFFSLNFIVALGPGGALPLSTGLPSTQGCPTQFSWNNSTTVAPKLRKCKW